MNVSGFAIQFIGIRVMHWSVALMQLATTFMVTGLRAWARQGMTKRPAVLKLETYWEAVDLALHIRKCSQLQILTDGIAEEFYIPGSPMTVELENSQRHSGLSQLYRDADRSAEPSTIETVRFFQREKVFLGDDTKTPRTLGHRTLEFYEGLEKIFPCDSEIESVTSSICDAMAAICTLISSSPDIILASPDIASIQTCFDVLVAGIALDGISEGLIQLCITVLILEGVVSQHFKNRIRSIIALTYRGLTDRKAQLSLLTPAVGDLSGQQPLVGNGGDIPQATQARNSYKASEIVYPSNTGLLNTIALDILSTFFSALTAKIECLGGITTGKLRTSFILPVIVLISNRDR